jgi:hypothetical protein
VGGLKRARHDDLLYGGWAGVAYQRGVEGLTPGGGAGGGGAKGGRNALKVLMRTTIL